ncbi:ATP-dependent helicase, partial [Streptomyces sp. NPDC021356]
MNRDRARTTRSGGSASGRTTAARRPRRSPGNGRRQAAPQGEFAMPETVTPALPAVESFADLDLPAPLLAT